MLNLVVAQDVVNEVGSSGQLPLLYLGVDSSQSDSFFANIFRNKKSDAAVLPVYFGGDSGCRSNLDAGFDYFDEKSLRVWVSSFFNWTGLKSADSNNIIPVGTYRFDSYGFAVGVDRTWDRSFLTGVMVGWNRTRADPPRGASENLSATYALLYFRKTFQRIYADIEGGIGYGDGTEKNQLTQSANNSFQWNLRYEMGTWWDEGLMKVEPFGVLQYASLDESKRKREQGTAIAGLRFSWKSTGLFAVSTPRFYGGFIRELCDTDVTGIGVFTDSPMLFIVDGRNMPKGRFFGGCGVTATMGSSLEIYFRYTAEAASKYNSHSLLVGMNWIF
ncbi:MAG: autotransporter outer membrane beta-barrel domain-containing protein [Planctomycetaceae bacterium]|nr:autotransporter outer membrane beta-barrel domain-containing protein [Planctomycetaceae bacterium]